jgi:5-methylcytosine-specific restriction endonuclease McrA
MDSAAPVKVCRECGRELPATPAFFHRKRDNRDGLHTKCKECANAYARRNQKARRDASLSGGPELREEYLSTHRRYRESHREELATKQREYCKRKKESPSYKKPLRTREKATEYRTRWRGANRERWTIYRRNRRARKKGAEGTHTTDDIKAQYDRQKGKCFYCKKKVGIDYHVDHVVPLSLGGSNGPENLVIACPSCNCRKSNKHPMDFGGRML